MKKPIALAVICALLLTFYACGKAEPADVATLLPSGTTSQITTTTEPDTETTSMAETTTEDEISEDSALSIATTRTTASARTTTTQKQSATMSEIQRLLQVEKDRIANSALTAEEKEAAMQAFPLYMDKNNVFYRDNSPPFGTIFGGYSYSPPVVQMIYGTVRVKFQYGYVHRCYIEGAKKGQVMYDAQGKPVYETDAQGNPIPKDWMIQMWKGRFGLVMLGSEIMILTKPSTQVANHYYEALPEEILDLKMDVYQKNLRDGTVNKLFSRGPISTEWLNGFVPGTFYQYNNKAEIILVGSIEFPNEEMLQAFETAFAAAGFAKGTPGRDNPETYAIDGTTVTFAWQYVDMDA